MPGRHYTAAGFLDKNKDVQQDQLFELMYNSLKAFVQDLTRFQVGLSESREFGILHYAGPSLHSGQLLRQE